MIRLTTEEAWDVVAGSHTGILTTLRRDGMPIALPVWFVVDDHTIALMTPGPRLESMTRLALSTRRSARDSTPFQRRPSPTMRSRFFFVSSPIRAS